jgi:hypothetical protein
MAPGTNTGAAHPVALGGGQMDSTMKEKVENDSAALMRSVVAKRGRNVELAESAVRQSKSWSDAEALKEKLIDVVAPDEPSLFRQLEGRVIKRFDGSETALHLVGRPVREFPMTLKQKILGYMMDPNVAFILLAIGLLALYTEFNHPGAVVPGVVGLIFILLAIFAFNMLPTRFAALTLILAAFVLFALEAQIADLPDEDKQVFLSDLGLEEPGLDRLIRAAYLLLGLETYFTAGPKEVRAWTIHHGDTAPKAAGVIHTDFEKGFIRAEVITYDDYVSLKGEQGAKEAGKMRPEGKDYVVRDGDVMHFRFNV